jgi:peptidoglycan/LPS O-acetylase OafA/YrhL
LFLEIKMLWKMKHIVVRGRNKVKKERLFYLDFIRAIATISIVMTHFNARYLYLSPPMPEKAIVTTTVSNIYIGNWGVSLFFIISGAALMYIYEDKCNWKEFYRKRFLSIYPMFWIAYSFAFLYLFYSDKRIPSSAVDVPKINIIFSCLGLDGLLVRNIPMFYILGEWFLGVIIIMYLIFPILRKLIINYSYATVIGVIAVYLWMIFGFNFNFDRGTVILTRLPEICFGMYYIRFRKRVNGKVAFLSLLILVTNGLLKPNWSQDIQTTYVGIFSFLLLVYFSYYLERVVIKKVCGVISKYSYATFLVHHVVIERMMKTFNLMEISVLYSYILFIVVCVVVAFFAWLLYNVHDKIIKKICYFYMEEIQRKKKTL